MQPYKNIDLTAGEPFKRYVKTCKYSLSGNRLDPLDSRKPETFILGSTDHGFDYDSHVLEVYSEAEDKYIRQRNKYLFQQGLLAPYTEGPSATDMTNVLSDEEINEIAATRLPNHLKPKLEKFTSLVTINRILEAANALDRPKSIINAIEKYKETLVK